MISAARSSSSPCRSRPLRRLQNYVFALPLTALLLAGPPRARVAGPRPLRRDTPARLRLRRSARSDVGARALAVRGPDGRASCVRRAQGSAATPPPPPIHAREASGIPTNSRRAPGSRREEHSPETRNVTWNSSHLFDIQSRRACLAARCRSACAPCRDRGATASPAPVPDLHEALRRAQHGELLVFEPQRLQNRPWAARTARGECLDAMVRSWRTTNGPTRCGFGRSRNREE